MPVSWVSQLTNRLQVVAVNGAAEKVSVVQRDAGLLERGKHARRLGVNVVVADFFDAGRRAAAAGMQSAECWHGRRQGWLNAAPALAHPHVAECHLFTCMLLQLRCRAEMGTDHHE